jgi:fumarylacetoacetate (FAA) hydrolase
MKLASYNDGSRDGQLVVVSRDLSLAHYATGVATRLQQVLDDWNFMSPQLQELSQTLNHGKARHAFAFDPAKCMAPLPRTGQWAQASAYPSHLQRLHPGSAPSSEPLFSQRASDELLAPHAAIDLPSDKMGIDFAAGLAVVTGDVARGSSADAALESVRLLLLSNDISLRQLAPTELARGQGLVLSQPGTAFGPVAITPDELGGAWQRGRVHLSLHCTVNGKRFGVCDTGPEMGQHFGQLIAYLAQTRRLRAGSIIGSGPISGSDATRGFSNLAEKRAQEMADKGEARTDWLRAGDNVRIDVKDLDGQSLFGAIEQSLPDHDGE